MPPRAACVSAPVPEMREGAVNGVERGIEAFRQIFGEETQDVAAVFLEQSVLATVAAIGGGVGEVLRAVDLDGELEPGAEQIYLHLAPVVEGDRQFAMTASTFSHQDSLSKLMARKWDVSSASIG